VSAALDFLYPLSEFYAGYGLPLPAARRVEPGEMPEASRRLLVHDHDMTPTLESAYGQRLHLRVRKYSYSENVFSRHVLLVLEDETVTGMGAIKINLAGFAEDARRLVFEREKPLGAILGTQRIEHSCHPASYFEVTADAMIGEALRVAPGQTLRGRQNVMWRPGGEVLAQIVEILPPLNPFARSATRSATRGATCEDAPGDDAPKEADLD
jgi:chorismate-pyruvate lyase